MFSRSNRGFTLVELLVVIAIIGMLVGILLPAVQGARNAGRRTQNSNNLKNIGLAALTYENAQGRLPALRQIRPTGTRVPRGMENYPDAAHSVSWAFELLPYLELQNVYDNFDRSSSAAPTVNQVAAQQLISIYQNPSRGERVATPDGMAATLIDYAANRGVAPFRFSNNGNQYVMDMEEHAETIGPFVHNGEVSMAHVKDGVSKTIAIADKWVPSGDSGFIDENGLAGASSWAIMRGPSARVRRSGGRVSYNPNEPIFPAGKDDQSVEKFGGADSGQLGACYLDGHVEWIQYDTDPDTFMSQCTIAGSDGLNVQ